MNSEEVRELGLQLGDAHEEIRRLEARIAQLEQAIIDIAESYQSVIAKWAE